MGFLVSVKDGIVFIGLKDFFRIIFMRSDEYIFCAGRTHGHILITVQVAKQPIESWLPRLRYLFTYRTDIEVKDLFK